MKKDNKGFIQLILIIIVVLVILSFMGIDPSWVWNKVFLPTIIFLWAIITWSVDILIKLLQPVIDIFRK